MNDIDNLIVGINSITFTIKRNTSSPTITNTLLSQIVIELRTGFPFSVTKVTARRRWPSDILIVIHFFDGHAHNLYGITQMPGAIGRIKQL